VPFAIHLELAGARRSHEAIPARPLDASSRLDWHSAIRSLLLLPRKESRADEIFSAIVRGNLHVDISGRYSLANVDEAHARLEAREQVLKAESCPTRKVAERAIPESGLRPEGISAEHRLASWRRRLGLSAVDFGLLMGASSQSIYNWEEGKVRPRTKHLPAIAALRTLGRKEAAARLESLREEGWSSRTVEQRAYALTSW
jgi:DNA-binding transcriptional regulator YiaG